MFDSDEKGKYFYNVTQPITFLADTTEVISGVVKLRVGVIDNISSGSPVGGGNLNNTTDKITRGNFNDVLAANKSFVADSGRHSNKTSGKNELKIQLKSKNLDLKKNIKGKTFNYSKERLAALEKKLIGTKPKLKTSKEGNGNNPPLPGNPTEDYCFAGPFQTTNTADAEVVVEGDEWCEELDECDEIEYLPSIILNQVPNGYNGRDLCTDEPTNGDPLEGVQVFWNEEINITNDICFNSNQDRVWYSGTSPLNINYILAVCNPNVTTYQLIADWTEISDTLVCNELEDIFFPIRIYGGRAMPPLPGYYLRVVINTHENEHKIDYQTAIDQALPEFNQALQNFVKHCSDFNDEADARSTLSSFLIKYFRELKRNASNNFNTIKEIAKNRSGDYETDVQHRRSVIDEINRQIAAINNARDCNVSLVDYYY